jgi:hypothetical protein
LPPPDPDRNGIDVPEGWWDVQGQYQDASRGLCTPGGASITYEEVGHGSVVLFDACTLAWHDLSVTYYDGTTIDFGSGKLPISDCP